MVVISEKTLPILFGRFFARVNATPPWAGGAKPGEYKYDINISSLQMYCSVVFSLCRYACL
jgi:hypothetical protein